MGRKTVREDINLRNLKVNKMTEKQILYMRRFYIIVLIFFFIIFAGEYWYFGMNITRDSIIFPIHITLRPLVIIPAIIIIGLLRKKV